METTQSPARILVFGSATEIEEVGGIFREMSGGADLIPCHERDVYVQELRQSCPDLICSTTTVQGLEGLEPLHLAKELCPQTPFVYFVENSDSGFCREALCQGTAMCLNKNNLEKLWPCIKNLLRPPERALPCMATSETLQDITQKFSLLANSLQEVFWLMSPQGEVVHYASPGHESLFGQPVDEFQQRPASFFEFVLPEDRRRLRSALSRAGSAEVRCEYRVLRGMDGNRWVQTRAYPVAGHENRIACISTDISDRKGLEHQILQAQRLEAIGTLAGGIAHDFNNILSTILGYAEIALSELPAELQVRADLEAILLAGNRAKELVQQILAFSRPYGQERAAVAIVPLLKETIRFIRATLPATIDIESDLDTNCLMVNAQPVQIQQIVMNLCTNAYHAMRDGGGTLGIRLEKVVFTEPFAGLNATLPPGEYVKLSISDTGHGIDEALIGKIFNPFFTTKPVGEGTGLGLTVVSRLVKSHGGALRVQSKAGRGTTFEAYLPHVRDEANKEVPQVREIPRGHERILLVDDEELLVTASKRLLSYLGYRVTAFTNSLSAFKSFEKSPDLYDLVLTDQTMPYLTGLELTKRILATKPDMPVILMTGYSETVTEDTAREAGVREVVLKPVLLQELGMMLRRVLDA